MTAHRPSCSRSIHLMPFQSLIVVHEPKPSINHYPLSDASVCNFFSPLLYRIGSIGNNKAVRVPACRLTLRCIARCESPVVDEHSTAFVRSRRRAHPHRNTSSQKFAPSETSVLHTPYGQRLQRRSPVLPTDLQCANSCQCQPKFLPMS